jgi:hypothetical protein
MRISARADPTLHLFFASVGRLILSDEAQENRSQDGTPAGPPLQR